MKTSGYFLGIGLVVIWTIAFGVSSALAVGRPSALASAFPDKLTGSTKTVEWEESGGGKLTCGKSTLTGEITSEKAGVATIVFEECEMAGVHCKGLGDTKSGTITVSDIDGNLYYAATSPSLEAVIVFSVPVIHSNCASVILLEKRGCAEIRLTPLNTSTTKYTATVETRTYDEYFTGTGEEKLKCSLELSKDHEPYVGLNESSAEGTATLESPFELMG